MARKYAAGMDVALSVAMTDRLGPTLADFRDPAVGSRAVFHPRLLWGSQERTLYANCC